MNAVELRSLLADAGHAGAYFVAASDTAAIAEAGAALCYEVVHIDLAGCTDSPTLFARIARGGPFEYRQDGGVFQNRERRLPMQPRGYYREYTVATPGARDRGPRRIVTGGDPPVEYWYTHDHYRSFRSCEIGGERAR